MVLYHLRDSNDLLVENRDFLPHLYLVSHRGWSRRNFRKMFEDRMMGYRVMKNCNNILSRFHTIPERNGQTDSLTCYQHRASVCWRAIKKNWVAWPWPRPSRATCLSLARGCHSQPTYQVSNFEVSIGLAWSTSGNFGRRTHGTMHERTHTYLTPKQNQSAGCNQGHIQYNTIVCI